MRDSILLKREEEESLILDQCLHEQFDVRGTCYCLRKGRFVDLWNLFEIFILCKQNQNNYKSYLI